MADPTRLGALGEQNETEWASMVEALSRHFRDQTAFALGSKNV